MITPTRICDLPTAISATEVIPKKIAKSEVAAKNELNAFLGWTELLDMAPFVHDHGKYLEGGGASEQKMQRMTTRGSQINPTTAANATT